MRLLKYIKAVTLLGSVSLPLIAAMPAQAIEDTIVYLECTADGKTSRGTGVIVSRAGHVLTAKHVVPDGSTCRGSIGVADSNLARRMVVRPTNEPVDATILQFSHNQQFSFAGYCSLNDQMIRKKILIAGYPGRTETGVASFREGILSTVRANAQGILETDAQSVAGMSGGPVYSEDLNGIVGIVIGAKFTPQGTPEYYGILPVETVARPFGLERAEQTCYRPKPSTEDLLARIKDLEGQLLQSQQDLEAQVAQKTGAISAELTQQTGALSAQITQTTGALSSQLIEKTVALETKIATKTGVLEAKLSEKTGELDGKISENKTQLALLDETQSQHADALVDHSKSLLTMEDHPGRLESAEGTLTEVEANIEWSASIIEETGGVQISYKKIVSSGGSIDEIGYFVVPFYRKKQADGEQGFVNGEGPTLASLDPEFGTLAVSPSGSKLGGQFKIHQVITNGFINSLYNLNRGTYHPDHPLTALSVTVTPVKDGALGEKVQIDVPISQDRWELIYNTYLENVENGS